MRIHDLSPSMGSRKKRKRVGRGTGSGHGKTSCRGYKGQKARSGGGKGPGFEGGQMPLQRRLPKRGFTNVFGRSYAVINLKDLSRFSPDKVLDIESFRTAGLVKKEKVGVKLLGQGEVSSSLRIRVNEVSKIAKQKIEAAGGRVEIV